MHRRENRDPKSLERIPRSDLGRFSEVRRQTTMDMGKPAFGRSWEVGAEFPDDLLRHWL